MQIFKIKLKMMKSWHWPFLSSFNTKELHKNVIFCDRCCIIETLVAIKTEFCKVPKNYVSPLYFLGWLLQLREQCYNFDWKKSVLMFPQEDYEGMDEKEISEMLAEREARTQATILEMIGDLPDADVAPPENVLFVCKLNAVTTDDDLEIIFSRFGKVKKYELSTLPRFHQRTR
jgi:hypothetical protein